MYSCPISGIRPNPNLARELGGNHYSLRACQCDQQAKPQPHPSCKGSEWLVDPRARVFKDSASTGWSSSGRSILSLLLKPSIFRVTNRVFPLGARPTTAWGILASAGFLRAYYKYKYSNKAELNTSISGSKSWAIAAIYRIDRCTKVQERSHRVKRHAGTHFRNLACI